MKKMMAMDSIEVPVVGELTLFKNNYPQRDYYINISIEEFTCLCPLTGQPDYAKFKITYVPDKLLVELKSLKLYLQTFRNKGITHEDVTNEIFDKMVKNLKPRELAITGIFNIRGGISTTVELSYLKGSDK